LTATLCLLAFGAVMVYSASSSRSLLEGQGNGSSQLIKFVIYGAIGLVVMRLLARNGLELARRATAPLLVISCLLVLAVHIPHVGVQINGARRWIGPSMLQFQPSELLKIALVLYAAELLARRPGRVASLRELYNPLLIVTGGACLLVATQPDLGTAMVIAFTLSALLLAAGMPLRTFAVLAGGAFALLALYALVQPYSRARLTSFIDPWSHASSSGFQAVQGQIAIGSGGLFGVGPGQSVQKAFYLPEAQTDFILAVIGEELGAFGICALVFLYGLIAYAGLRAAKAARSLYSALIAVGVSSLILSQALLNMFAVLGLAPLTGVPLPFVSYGSSSLLVMLAAMGLLLNVASGEGAHLRGLRAPRARAPAKRARAGDIAARKPRRSTDVKDAKDDRDRRRRDRGARGPGAGRGRRAAG
jgi:cell division protein FtsW